jgi:hypothetical protein
MNESMRDDLDDALARLPRDAEPSRDLWPQIRSAIQAESRPMRRAGALGLWSQIAAGFVLVMLSSVATYVVTKQSVQRDARVPEAQVNAVLAFYDEDALGPNYKRVRADLDQLFAERMASLPPAMRAKLQSNLADLRRASDEIAATLAEHPSDSLLQELLASTRRREIQLLADISQMQIPRS